MTIKRYKHVKKNRVKKLLIFYVFICIFFIASYTLSRYVTQISGDPEIGIAKFNVTVNDIDVTKGLPFELNLSPTTTTTDGKIAPNETGYFEIEINPNLTEVSLEYEFEFDFTEMPEKFKLTYFTINDKETKYPIENNIIKRDLILPNTIHGFTEEDKKTIKVYWSWEQEDITNPDINDINNKAISVKATVKQKIN